MTSPYTRTKSPESKARLSRSRSVSPTECDADFSISSLVNGTGDLIHRELLFYERKFVSISSSLG